MILEKFTSPLGGKSVNSEFFYYYLMGEGCCMQFCNHKNYFCKGKPFEPGCLLVFGCLF